MVFLVVYSVVLVKTVRTPYGYSRGLRVSRSLVITRITSLSLPLEFGTLLRHSPNRSKELRTVFQPGLLRVFARFAIDCRYGRTRVFRLSLNSTNRYEGDLDKSSRLQKNVIRPLVAGRCAVM